MKLSSRKQLLEEADDVLKNISKRRVDELDWEKHKSLFPKRAEELSAYNLKFVQWKYERDLYYIKQKYDDKTDSESMKKEIEELNQLIEKLRKHFSPENYQQIPEDPEQQSEIQKLIVNAPKLQHGDDYLKGFIQDPKTGMWWDSAVTGLPWISPEMKDERRKYARSMDTEYIHHSWDYTRGWFYNILAGIFKQIFIGGSNY